MYTVEIVEVELGLRGSRRPHKFSVRRIVDATEGDGPDRLCYRCTGYVRIKKPVRIAHIESPCNLSRNSEFRAIPSAWLWLSSAAPPEGTISSSAIDGGADTGAPAWTVRWALSKPSNHCSRRKDDHHPDLKLPHPALPYPQRPSYVDQLSGSTVV